MYFFLGYPAYDNGQVGIVIDPAATLTRDARFSPFDSGGLDTVKGTDRPHLVPTTPRPWAAADRLALLRELSGKGTDLPGYSALFLAAHFHEPRDYMRLGQRSDPDWPAYHGLAADDRDRRAWTVEVRVQEEVPLAASAGLRRILLADPRLRKSVAAAAEDLLDLVAVTRDEPGADDGERMATAIRRLLADQGVAT
ncbi:MAG: hypothetical protein HY905_27540 [Deltaproteobacteria bacterium]|nr:hypothetical protein [Deltaproteobacteria bacterium]